MPRIGGHKLYYLIKQDAAGCGYRFGEKKLFSVLREHGLLVKKQEMHVFTTDSSHWRNQFDNLVEETKDGCQPPLRAPGDKCLFQKDYGMGGTEDMAAASTLLALKMAIRNRVYDGPLIHHSDRGHSIFRALYLVPEKARHPDQRHPERQPL